MLLTRNSGRKDTAFLLIDNISFLFLMNTSSDSEQDSEQGTDSHRKRIKRLPIILIGEMLANPAAISICAP